MFKELFVHKRSLLIVALVVAVAAIVAGCGSSDETLTKAEMIKQSDAICVKNNTELQAKYDKFQRAHKGENVSLDDDEKEEVSTTIVAPAFQANVEELSELDSPDPEQTEAMIESAEAAIAASDKEPLVLLTFFEGPLNKTYEESKAYGYKICFQSTG